MSQEALLAEIQEERTKELAFEGHRWFDLRRTTRPRIEKVLNGQAYLLEQMCIRDSPSTQQANNKAAIYLFIIFFTFLLLQMYIIPTRLRNIREE